MRKRKEGKRDGGKKQRQRGTNLVTRRDVTPSGRGGGRGGRMEGRSVTGRESEWDKKDGVKE